MVDQTNNDNFGASVGSSFGGATEADIGSADSSNGRLAGGLGTGLGSGVISRSQYSGDMNFNRNLSTHSQRGFTQRLGDYANHLVQSTSHLGDQIMSRVGNTTTRVGGEITGRLDRHLRANPWLHIGVAGAAFLALGWYLGRRNLNDAPTIQGVAILEEDYIDLD